MTDCVGHTDSLGVGRRRGRDGARVVMRATLAKGSNGSIVLKKPVISSAQGFSEYLHRCKP
jgi:hypothetical protein